MDGTRFTHHQDTRINSASTLECINRTSFYAPYAFVLAGALSAYVSTLWLCIILRVLNMLYMMQAMHTCAVRAHIARFVAGAA
jgi:hypothetical protein